MIRGHPACPERRHIGPLTVALPRGMVPCVCILSVLLLLLLPEVSGVHLVLLLLLMLLVVVVLIEMLLAWGASSAIK